MGSRTCKACALAIALFLALELHAQPQTQSLPISEYRLVHIDGHTDILRMAHDKLERLDGNSLGSVWKRGLTAADQPTLAKFKTPDEDPTTTLRYIRQILTTCPDINGDGKGDFVLGLDYEPDLVAVDGTNGDVLWWYRNRARPEGMSQGPFDQVGTNYVLAEPLLFDVDADGVPDLITGFSCAAVTFRDAENLDKKMEYPAETVIQAISGRSGKRIWSYRLEGVLFSRPFLSGDFVDYDQKLGTWMGEPTITISAHGQMWTLKLKTGEPIGAPLKLSGLSLGQPHLEHARFFDLDGTGELAVLILKSGKDNRHSDEDVRPSLIVSVLRAANGQILWEVEHKDLSLDWRPQQEPNSPRACDWPAPFRISTKADDQREDVLLPFKRRREGHTYWHGIERIDGRTGKSVWRQRILLDEDTYNNHLTISRLITGLDLNGDGCPEVFAAFGLIDPSQLNATKKIERAGTPNHEHICITAVSGKDGGLFWQRQTADGLAVSPRGSSGLEPLQWFPPAANIHPQLVSACADRFDGQNCFVWIIEPTTGFVRDSLHGMEKIEAADGQGVILGHVPNSWNPRTMPDYGALVQWRSNLKTDDGEAKEFPAADAAVNLPTLAEFPWQSRPLPWASTRRLWWEIGGVTFIVLLALLLMFRRWRWSLALLLFVLIMSGGISYWLIHNNARLMDADEHYTSTNWYGVAAITATIAAPLAGLAVALAARQTFKRRAGGI